MNFTRLFLVSVLLITTINISSAEDLSNECSKFMKQRNKYLNKYRSEKAELVETKAKLDKLDISNLSSKKMAKFSSLMTLSQSHINRMNYLSMTMVEKATKCANQSSIANNRRLSVQEEDLEPPPPKELPDKSFEEYIEENAIDPTPLIELIDFINRMIENLFL